MATKKSPVRGKASKSKASSSKSSRGRKKAAGKKATGKKAAGKKTAGKKTAGKKAAGKKAAGKRAAGKKAPARKAPARKAPARKAPAKKAPAKKAPARKAPAGKAAGKAAGKKVTSGAAASKRTAKTSAAKGRKPAKGHPVKDRSGAVDAAGREAEERSKKAPSTKKAASARRAARAKKEDVDLPTVLASLGFFSSRVLFEEFSKVYRKERTRDTGTAILEALDRSGVGYWYDDLMVDEPEVYIEHVRRISELTRGAFDPSDVEVEEERGAIKLNFTLGDRSFSLSLREAESIDDVPIIMAVNQYFDESGMGTRLGLYTGQDQAGFISYGPIRGLLRLPSVLGISWGVRRDAAADLLAVESTDLADWPEVEFDLDAPDEDEDEDLDIDEDDDSVAIDDDDPLD